MRCVKWQVFAYQRLSVLLAKLGKSARDTCQRYKFHTAISVTIAAFPWAILLIYLDVSYCKIYEKNATRGANFAIFAMFFVR